MACELHCNGRAKVVRSGGCARKWLICLGLCVPGSHARGQWLRWVVAIVLTLCEHSGGGPWVLEPLRSPPKTLATAAVQAWFRRHAAAANCQCTLTGWQKTASSGTKNRQPLRVLSGAFSHRRLN
jgi:hypothetical protein